MVKMSNELNLCYTGIDIQSYLLLKERLKPVIRVLLERNVLEDAKKAVEKLGIKLIAREFKQLYGGHLEKKAIIAYYSLDKNLCKQAMTAEQEGKRKEFGQLLGYPDCCIDNFIKNLVNGVDYTLVSLHNVRTRASFYCNNLFVFDSKLDSFQLKTYFDNHNILYGPHQLFLIRHVPCSFDCKHSIKIGKITLKLLKNNSPDLFEKILGTLKRPLLYWNYFEWVLFNGYQEGNEVKYDGILNYESLLNDKIKKIFENGNKFKVDNEKISVFNSNENIEEIPRKDGIPVCINFQ